MLGTSPTVPADSTTGGYRPSTPRRLCDDERVSSEDGPELPDVRVSGFVLTGAVDDDVDTDRVAAIEEGTRRRVVLRLLPELAVEERHRLDAMLARYAQVTDDNLAAPVTLASDGDALVLPTAPHAPLDRLWAAVRTAGQAATVAVPTASALAALHRAGLAHGMVRPRAVLVDADGRPRLGDAGERAALHALAPTEVAEPTVDDDVAALHAVLGSLAEHVADPTLDDVVRQLRDAQADAATVAAVLLDRVAPEPLGEVEAAEPTRDEPVPREARAGAHDRGSRRRQWVLMGAAAVVAAGLAAVGILSADDPDEVVAASPTAARAEAERIREPENQEDAAAADAATTPGADPTPEATPQISAGTQLCGAPGPAPDEAPDLEQDWAEVVRQLYLRRSAALVTGQTFLLCDVYDPRSPGLVSDLELDAAYDGRRLRPDALVFEVEEATLLGREGALLTLVVTDRLEPYRLLDPDGDVVAELPGIDTETWQARLVPDESGREWRFA